MHKSFSAQRGRYLMVRCLNDKDYQKWTSALTSQISTDVKVKWVRPALTSNPHPNKVNTKRQWFILHRNFKSLSPEKENVCILLGWCLIHYTSLETACCDEVLVCVLVTARGDRGYR